MNKKICVGIICFNVKCVLLDGIVQYFKEENVILFDNGAGIHLQNKYPNAVVLGNGENKGVGYACNSILNYSKKMGWDYVVLSDQDSVYPNSYIPSMSNLYSGSKNIIAILPSWIDLNSDENFKKKQYVYSKFHLKLESIKEEFSEISHGIMSGMIINLDLINESLLFDEDLFIDWLDTEWCWRAKFEFGYKTMINTNVVLYHELGTVRKKILGKRFTVRNKSRDYYIIRNALYIVLHLTLPLKCKIHALMKVIHHSIFSMLISLLNFQGISYIFKAYYDAFFKIMGKK